jgi:hypothetical protein
MLYPQTIGFPVDDCADQFHSLWSVRFRISEPDDQELFGRHFSGWRDQKSFAEAAGEARRFSNLIQESG